MPNPEPRLVSAAVLGRTYLVAEDADVEVIQPLKAMIDAIVFYLSPRACALFLDIYADWMRTGGHAVPADFRRRSVRHRLYRELRHSILLRPAEGGQWEAGKAVEVCTFSHMIYRHAHDQLLEKANDAPAFH